MCDAKTATLVRDGQSIKSTYVTRYTQDIRPDFKVGYPVSSRPRSKHEGILSCAAGKNIPALATDRKIIALAAIKKVPPISTDQRVVPSTAVQSVRPSATGELVLTSAAKQTVPTG